ncbi:MAG: mucoidy inhibitor MuiA family protein, partial [Planctomycetota bacterium]|nr:mucoidy inhibitor MuiA family protein [Planctomycetota bacterium]
MRTRKTQINCLILATALAAAASRSARAEEQPAGIQLPIDSVTVYEDRALVERQGEVDVAQGVSTVRVDGLPVSLNEISIRAAIAEGQGTKVISITTRTEHKLETQNAEQRALENQEDDLLQSLREMELKESVFADEAKYIQDFEKQILKGISERVTLGSANAKELSDTGAFLSKRRTALAEKRRAMSVDREKINENLQETRKKLRKISTPGGKQIRFAEVVLESEQAGRITLAISYLISRAAWSPRYEVRLKGGTL